MATELVRLIRRGTTVSAHEGTVELVPVPASLAGVPDDIAVTRQIDVEQSNSSVVLDDRLILKVFRRLEAGVNPELELLRFLTEHGFANIARLAGWYQYVGRPMEATLGILQQFVPDGRDGWELALDVADRPHRVVSVRARAPRRGDRGAARGARVRLDRPELRPGADVGRVARSPDRDRRRGDRGDLHRPAGRRSRARAAPRSRRGGARAAPAADEPRRRRARDPPPRRLPPRAGAAHRRAGGS